MLLWGLNALYNAREKQQQNELITHKPLQCITYKKQNSTKARYDTKTKWTLLHVHMRIDILANVHAHLPAHTDKRSVCSTDR